MAPPRASWTSDVIPESGSPGPAALTPPESAWEHRPSPSGEDTGLGMRVLIIGGGGREHALAWKLAQSPDVTELFAAPGNAGIARHASCVPIDQSAVVELGDFADSIHVDLTV